MADFAEWVSAAEPALGWQAGSFMHAYTTNREAANELTLEASPVAAIIREKLSLPARATATELLFQLETLADDKAKRSKSWPGSGRVLSNALRRQSSALAATGIEIAFHRPSRQTAGRRLIIITRPGRSEGIFSSPPSPSSPGQQNQRFFGVDRGDDRDDRSAFASPSGDARVEDGLEEEGETL
jgi:hypothetical protein